jgi:hypothetical protein
MYKCHFGLQLQEVSDFIVCGREADTQDVAKQLPRPCLTLPVAYLTRHTVHINVVELHVRFPVLRSREG